MSCDEAIVLVGGLGTRLRPLVSEVPKPLAPVAGRPFLAWLLQRLAAHGIRRVVLAAGYRAEQVREVFGSRWNGLDVAYSVEDAPLGTGGAIALALRLRTGEAVHVLNGDTFLAYDPRALEAATRASGRALGMALARVADVARYGAVTLDGARVAGFREKGEAGPGHINAGSYFLDAAAIARMPAAGAFSFEQTVLAAEVAAGQVQGFTATAGFIDIGVPEDYLRAQTVIPEVA